MIYFHFSALVQIIYCFGANARRMYIGEKLYFVNNNINAITFPRNASYFLLIEFVLYAPKYTFFCWSNYFQQLYMFAIKLVQTITKIKGKKKISDLELSANK